MPVRVLVGLLVRSLDLRGEGVVAQPLSAAQARLHWPQEEHYTPPLHEPIPEVPPHSQRGALWAAAFLGRPHLVSGFRLLLS